jgi:hypothetical protein
LGKGHIHAGKFGTALALNFNSLAVSVAGLAGQVPGGEWGQFDSHGRSPLGRKG